MNAREWKPGDVAMLQVGTPSERIGLRTARNDGWRTAVGAMSDATTPLGAMHHPLVVIDPEDREQVERLFNLLDKWSGQVPYSDMSEPGDLTSVDAVSAALREFVAPPKPEEPTGLGAVVEDSEGVRWTRVEAGDSLTRNPWYPDDADKQPADYADIAAVLKLAEGIR